MLVFGGVAAFFWVAKVASSSLGLAVGAVAPNADRAMAIGGPAPWSLHQGRRFPRRVSYLFFGGGHFLPQSLGEKSDAI